MRKDCQCPKARHEHGTKRAYAADGCRCLRCRAAHANAAAAYRRGQSCADAYVDASDTKRRLRALAAAGVTTRRVAAHAGISADMVTYLRSGKQKRVTPRHAELIARAFDALWLTGRNDPNARRTMTIVRALGYSPDLDDDKTSALSPTACTPDDDLDTIDEIAVQEAIHGRKVRLNRAETSEAIARLTRMGWSAEQIAERLGIASRTVVRRRGRVEESVAA